VVAHSVPAAGAQAPATHDRLAWRSWLPWALIVVAATIGLTSALNIWVKRQALSTDNWTNASTRLLENDEIRGALSVYLVDQLYANGNVPQALAERLPPRLKPLAGPLAGALQDPAVRVTDRVLERPRVQQLWKEANRRAHKLFIAVLDGKHGLLVTTNDQVVLDLRPLIQRVSEQEGLGSRVAQRLPEDAGQIVIMNGNQLSTARRTVKVVRALSYFLFFLVIALYAAAIWLARGRRRKLLMGCGISVLTVGLLILVIRRYAGDYLVSTLTGESDAKGAVSAAWAIGTELLRNAGINAVIYGLAIIIAAWIAGPSRAATWLRRVLAPTMRDQPWLVYGAVSVVLFLILLAGPTDKERILPLLILFGFAFAGTEVLRRQTAREFPVAGSS
jgi:hypothetical protein